MSDYSKAKLLCLNADVDTYMNLAKNLQNSVRDVLKDKELPIEDRWELFTKSSFLPSTDDSDGSIGIISSDLSLYDHFYVDRYETRSYGEIYTHLMDNIEKLTKACKLSSEDYMQRVYAWREYVLSRGYHSFTSDW